MFLGRLKMFSVQVINALYCHAAKWFHCQYISYSKVGSLQLNHVAGIATMILFFLMSAQSALSETERSYILATFCASFKSKLSVGCWLRKEEVAPQISSYCAPPAFVDLSVVKCTPGPPQSYKDYINILLKQSFLFFSCGTLY